MTYKELVYEDGSKAIERDNGDGSFTYIPIDPANSDYQRYLNPEAEQSTPSVIHEAKAK
jgi:hypothetical protein